jgi:hypothetical protein
MLRAKLLVLVLPVVALASCSIPGQPEPLRDFSDNPVPIVGDGVFFGEVVEITGFDPEEWMIGSDGPFDNGGPESTFLSGSAHFVLYDGTGLDVASATPAGNMCLSLNPYEAGLDPVDAIPLEDPCTIAGEYAQGQTVAWFEVIDNASQSSLRKTYRLHLEGFQSPNHAVVTVGLHLKMAVPIADDVERVACAEDAAMAPEIYASSQGTAWARVDAETLTVVRIDCNNQPIERP